MKVLDKDEAYKAGIRFPNEVCSPWDMVKAIEWAMNDHVRRFHTNTGLEQAQGDGGKDGT